MTETEAPASGTSVYGEFLKDELAIQDARKASFEQRGITVVTTSGVLVTLLFGVGALSTKGKQTFVLTHSARIGLIVALVLFVLAAAAALATNVPLLYETVTTDAILNRLKEEPVRDGPAAERDVALTRLKSLRSAKKQNGLKGALLFAAMTLEVTAVGTLGAAIWLVINP